MESVSNKPKFIRKNEKKLNELNNYLYDNKDHIQKLIFGYELYRYFMDNDLIERYCGRNGWYLGFRCYYDEYAPAAFIEILLKNTPKFEFNIK
jgi:hypothetical protein